MGSVFWGFHALSATLARTRGRLIREGPYRYSRNPQYASSFCILAGGRCSAFRPGVLACLAEHLYFSLHS